MIKNFQAYKKRHMAFWQLDEVDSPLVGFTVGAGSDSWSYWQDNEAAQVLFRKEEINVDDIHPEAFVEDQQRYLEESSQIDDDICRTAMPLASIPWMEAILGCPVFSSGTNLKSGQILESPDLLTAVEFDQKNPWIQKYFQFINTYHRAFGDRFPVGQSILRGPSDVACAMLGAENATMALATNPADMQWLLQYVTNQLEQFLRLQLDYLPSFNNGYVIGQYEIWAPEPAIRIQEDFSVLYSPKLYDHFLMHLDKQLAAISEYNLIHLHASSLFLIDHFLEVSTIRAFQVSKDAGIDNIDHMLPALKKIQSADKPLIVKGRFDDQDLKLMKKNLSLYGLSVQPVVSGIKEAEEMLPHIRAWR